MKYSNHVESVFRESGWNPGREVDIAAWVKILKKDGFTMLPEAISILKSLGDLIIRPPKSPANIYPPEDLTFDPTFASGEYDRIEYWENYLGTHLSPIGEFGGWILLIAGDGKVYSCRDQLLKVRGDSFQDALENTLIWIKRKPTVFRRNS
jgi:hypothetical protein